MPFRNEDWILALSARAVMMWTDELILLDHCSTDNSRDIALEVAAEFPGRVTILEDSNPEWQEMRHRQMLLDCARKQGVTHIALVDADEVLSGNLLPEIRSHVQTCPQGRTLQFPWQCLRGSINRTHVDGTWGRADVSVAFLDDPAFHWVSREGYDFHHRHPMGRPFRPFSPIGRDGGGLLHLQFVSDRRLRAKQYLYQLTERLRWPNREPVDVVRKRYSTAVYEHNAMADVPASWWAPYGHLMKYLDIDAEPWQEAACRKILGEHPGISAGLDSFGVAA